MLFRSRVLFRSVGTGADGYHSLQFAEGYPVQRHCLLILQKSIPSYKKAVEKASARLNIRRRTEAFSILQRIV